MNNLHPSTVYSKKTLLIGWCLVWLLLALLVPQFKAQQHNHTKNISIVLDVSKSMNVRDVEYAWSLISRLDASKRSIETILTTYPNVKVALTVFAWTPVWVVPLTTNHEVVRSFLDGVDHSFVVEQGTDIVQAVSYWLAMVQSTFDSASLSTMYHSGSTIVVLSDWWDDNDLMLESVDILDDTVRLITVWVWSSWWWPIPELPDLFGKTHYVTYQWEQVISSLNDSGLQDLSSSLWWEYIDWTGSEEIIHRIGTTDPEELWIHYSFSFVGRLIVVVALGLFVRYLVDPFTKNFYPSVAVWETQSK